MSEREKGFEHISPDDITIEEAPDQHEESDEITPGEQIIRNLETFPKDYHVGAEHKALFGMLEERESDKSYPVTLRSRATFTTFGLEYNGRRLPYKPEVREAVHELITEQVLKQDGNQKDPSAIMDLINNENKVWMVPLKVVLMQEYIKRAKAKYDEKDQQLVKKEESLPKNRKREYSAILQSRARAMWTDDDANALRRRIKEKNEEAIKSGKPAVILTEKEIEDRINTRKARFIQRMFETLRFEDVSSFGIKERIMTPEDSRDYAAYRKKRDELLKQCKTIFLGDDVDDIDKIKDSEQFVKSIKRYIYVAGSEETEKIPKRYPDIFPGLNYITMRVKHKIRQYYGEDEDVPTVVPDNAIDQILDLCDSDDNREVLADIINTLGQLGRRYYGELFPKYLSAEKKFFDPEYKRRALIRQQRLRLQEEELLYIEEQIPKKADAKIEDYKRRMASNTLDGQSGEYKDICVLATGVVGLRNDGGFDCRATMPLDERILEIFDEDEERQVWNDTWLKCWDNRKRLEISDKVARSYLQHQMKERTPELEDKFDKKVKDILETYQIEGPITLNEAAGCVYDSIQESDLPIMEELLPIFGGFVKSVNVFVSDKDLSLTSTRIEVAKYLSGGDYKNALSLVQGNCELNLREIQRLRMAVEPEKLPRFYSRVSSELGVSLYNNLSPENHRKFTEMVKNQTAISEIDFYKIFRTRIPNPETRHKVAERTVFLREFNRYLSNKSSQEMKDFFDSIKKKVALT